MPNQLPSFQTNGIQNDCEATPRSHWRFRATELIEDGPDGAILVKARVYKGDENDFDADFQGPKDYVVQVLTEKEVGKVFYATKPEGGTGSKYGDPLKPVVWAETGGGSSLPPGTGRYKVLMLIDDLDPGTPAWDYERFN